MLLEAASLSKRYGEKTVLDGASFAVDSGELVSVMGPSGEGKSTVARILCGTVKPDDGHALFMGDELVRAGAPYNAAHRLDIQLIPQQPFASLDPRQTIGSAVMEPLLFHRLSASKAEARRAALELMERCLLSPELFERRPGELSGGQAQRALIARSLAVGPKLLIADEATSMLDISSQAEIIRIFLELIKSDGISILLITHDAPLAASVSDRIYLLERGKMTLRPTEERNEKAFIHNHSHVHAADAGSLRSAAGGIRAVGSA